MRRKIAHGGQRLLSASARQEIAARAARLLAEDHAADFSAAKRKAAQQLGLADTARLPSNQEVEEALEQHRAIFEPEHEKQLHELRQKALYLMRFFAGFRPYLTGSVLSGAAGHHSDINLILYHDDPKSIELFLIDRQIEYRYQDSPSGHRFDDYPTLAFLFDQTPVRLHVRPPIAERQPPRHEQRASPGDLEKLLAAEEDLGPI